TKRSRSFCAVASSPMRTIKSFCTARISSEINLSVETDLAKPRAAVSSSTQPYASTRGSPFDTRWPYIRDVSPLSPVLVTIDMAILGGILERLGKRVMGFVVAHYFITPLPPEFTRWLAVARLLPSPVHQFAHLFLPT